MKIGEATFETGTTLGICQTRDGSMSDMSLDDEIRLTMDGVAAAMAVVVVVVITTDLLDRF